MTPSPRLQRLIDATDWLSPADAAAAVWNVTDETVRELPSDVPEGDDAGRPRLMIVGRNTRYGSGGLWSPNVVIGRYCTIGRNVDIGATAHAMTALGTGFLSRDVPEEAAEAAGGPAPTVIGCDVWIGRGSFVRGGVTVGHGTVIQPGSVVVSNVQPYAVMEGAPARQVARRVPPEIAERLLRAAWWRFPSEVVAALPKHDRDGCLARVEEYRRSTSAPA